MSTLSNVSLNAYSQNIPKNCAGQPDGLMWIKPDANRAIQVFCEGEWILMQARTGPTVNFHRDWSSYAKGFGDETNFWLGNDHLHALTVNGARLRVVLHNVANDVRIAEYSTFSVASEAENFRVVFDEYSGNAGDALSFDTGNSFSTWDADHDHFSGNCAEIFSGGWWYTNCYHANVNGVYQTPGPGATPSGIIWNTWEGWSYSMESCYMWVQPNV